MLQTAVLSHYVELGVFREYSVVRDLSIFIRQSYSSQKNKAITSENDDNDADFANLSQTQAGRCPRVSSVCAWAEQADRIASPHVL